MSEILAGNRLFAVHDRAGLLAFMGARSFAAIIAVADGLPHIAHAPVLIAGEEAQFHLARGNPLIALAAKGETLTLLFDGAEGYISPDWYETAGLVPTWNYVRVAARGRARLLDRAALAAQVEAVSAHHERALAPKPLWTKAKMPDGAFERMLGGIEGISVALETIEGQAKLSQNRQPADHAGVIAGLTARGDGGSLGLAKAMQSDWSARPR
ncbi:MAG: FMN-binding negative transcriptional regulator [Alphaproteobacteria bacterium]|nr:FMN-binding negative transcriptional regulator [Alphaproteobacteria bacterium]